MPMRHSRGKKMSRKTPVERIQGALEELEMVQMDGLDKSTQAKIQLAYHVLEMAQRSMVGGQKKLLQARRSKLRGENVR